MRGLKQLRRLAVAATIASLLVGLVPAEAAASHSDRWWELQQKIRQTRAKLREARERERGLMAQIAASDRRRMSLERNLALLSDQMLLAGRRLELLELARDEAAIELDLKTAELQETLAALEDQTTLLEDRAASIYISGPGAYTAVLLGARDFHSYVAGLEYAESVLHADIGIVEEIRELKARIEVERAEIARRRAALEKQADLVAEARERLAALRARQARARARLVEEIGYRRHLLQRVRSEKEAHAAALQSYLEESASIAAMLRGAQKGQKVVQGRGGYLKWPVSGRITSGYGWRTHPIYGYRSFHTGIDIGAPSGTTVKAARYGEILYVGYRGAYGLIVLIDHGNSLATLYAHLSKSYVRAGQSVGTLAAVGAVGCTGWCTGPHLHFEVRVQGEPQNPMNWL